MQISSYPVKTIAAFGLIVVWVLAAAQDDGTDEASSQPETEQSTPVTGAAEAPEIPPRFIPKETISAESVISFPADI